MLMAPNAVDLQAAIAVTRFGMGARPGDLDQARGDPKAWLLSQIRPEGADQPQGPAPSTPERLAALAQFREDRRDARKVDAAMQPEAAGQNADQFKAELQKLYREIGQDFLARARLSAETPAGFRERWALFWANHFTVSGVKLQTAVVAGAYELEAIRPNVFGRFEDLLVAAVRHPAMLLYLDQAQSFGPNSPATRYRKVGLNENLAREILELHTVGVDAGYTQADVTEFARALTGWSVGGEREPARAGRYVFRSMAHEPGARTVMGKRYGDWNEDQGRRILHDLADHPATARHICRKIAVHFVADEPPPSLVDALTRAWTGSGGRLDVVARALVEAPEAWDPAASKVKTPYDFIISGYRTIGAQPTAIEKLSPILNGLGQRPFSPPSPKGWPEEAGAWVAPDAVVKRLEWAKAFSAVVADRVDPPAVARSALGARLTERTETAVRRAESRQEALALLLMSPEFQRR
jgi:uncharacterized protein (DUF1800 family)